MSRRIFIALPISETLQSEILAWEQAFQRLPVRWLKDKNLHITLIPPWYEENVERMVKGIKEVKGMNGRLELQFKRVTFGPNPHAPRLIWAEGPTPPLLTQLKSNLEQALHFKPESRPFRLHLTLARFRPENFHSFPINTLNENVSWHDTAQSFVLMESHLHLTGAEYEVIQEITL